MLDETPSRRSVLASGATALAAVVLSAANTGQHAVRGRVVDETVARRDSAEAGIPRVLVSNGIEVAMTDPSGHWQLPYRSGAFIFPIKPSDWSLPNRTNGLPSIGVRLGDEPPSDLLTFELKRGIEPRKFSVALIADTQPQSVTELGYLRDTVLSAVAQSGAVFAINHGDVVFDAPALYDRYINLIASTGMPWHHTPGNHDMSGSGSSSRFENWKSTFGPTHYAFQYGGATFIILNNVHPLPVGQYTASGHDYRGHISADQLVFVERVLRAVPQDDLLVLSFHIPLVGFEDPHDDAGRTDNAAELLRIISSRPNTLSLAGHTHTTEHHYLGAEHGFPGAHPHHHHVLTAACGSWWSGPFDSLGQPVSLSRDGTPKGLHILDIDGSRYSTRLAPVGHAGHAKMSVALKTREDVPGAGSDDRSQPFSLERCVRCGGLDQSELLVNVFDGGPRTTVTCILRSSHGSNAKVHEIRFDKLVAQDAVTTMAYAAHRSVIKPWVEAGLCSHLWSAPLPAKLQAGSYTADIVVSDEYGRRHGTSFIFEVAT